MCFLVSIGWNQLKGELLLQLLEVRNISNIIFYKTYYRVLTLFLIFFLQEIHLTWEEVGEEWEEEREEEEREQIPSMNYVVLEMGILPLPLSFPPSSFLSPSSPLFFHFLNRPTFFFFFSFSNRDPNSGQAVEVRPFFSLLSPLP